MAKLRVGTIWGHTRSEIEVSNYAIFRYRVPNSVSIETTARSAPLSIINNSLSVSLEKHALDSSHNPENLSPDNWSKWVSLSTGYRTGRTTSLKFARPLTSISVCSKRKCLSVGWCGQEIWSWASCVVSGVTAASGIPETQSRAFKVP